jgi:hypothetical protein
MNLEKTNPEYIVSLRLNMNYNDQVMKFASSAIFTNIISLTLVNFQDTNQIIEYEIYFPNLICLSLWYDYIVNYQMINRVFQQLQNSIKRFELHCIKEMRTRYCTNLLRSSFIRNRTIEYFLLDIYFYKLNSMNNSSQDNDSWFLIKTIGLIKSMINIRYVHCIINNENLEKCLNVNKWKNLVNECHQLTKITLQVTRDMFEGKQLTQKIQKIQKELFKVRETIKFQIIYN